MHPKQIRFPWTGLLILSALVIFICMILLLTGTVTLSVDCFAVDSSGRLYVGRSGQIDVYENGTLLRSITEFEGLGDIPLKGMVFTIDQKDIITIATGGYVISTDLNGKVLETQKDTSKDSTRIKLERYKHIHRTAGGDLYRLEYHLGRTRIVKNETEIVYQISPLSFAAKIGLITSVICFSAGIVAIIVQDLKERI